MGTEVRVREREEGVREGEEGEESSPLFVSPPDCTMSCRATTSFFSSSTK